MSVDYVALNTGQPKAEHDPFTAERYRQFARHIPAGAARVLDVGCATGRGGRALKEVRPELRIDGLDCMRSRLDQLPRDAYAGVVCSYTTAIDAPDGA